MDILLREESISFGIRLKELLKEKGITQLTFAKELGMSPNTVNAWITEKSQIKQNKDAVLKKISDYFDVDIEYIKLEQVEKREPKLDKPAALDKIRKEVKKLNAYLPYLSFLGINIQGSVKDVGEPYEYKCISEGKLQTYLIHDSEAETLVTYKGKSKSFNSKEFNDFLDNISNFVKFTTENVISDIE